MKKQRFLLRRLVGTTYLDDVAGTATVETTDSEENIQKAILEICTIFDKEKKQKEEYLDFIQRKMQEIYPTFKISKVIKKYRNLLI